MPGRVDAARALLARERFGVLATLSTTSEGWPFASVTAYALSPEGEPLLMLSSLAEHTRNVRADPRVSLLVQDSTGLDEPQAGARLTLMGAVEPLGKDQQANERYVERHPSAAEYLQMLDFAIYVLRIRHARYIAGFANTAWLDAAEFLARR